MKDWRGKSILPGTTIVYPGRRGARLYLNQATVVSAHAITNVLRDLTVEVTHRNGTALKLPRRATLTRVDLVTVVDL